MRNFRDQTISRDLFLVAFGIAATAIITVNLLIEPSRFSDYDTYLTYLDSIWYFPTATPWYMEPLSRAYLLVVRTMSETADQAIDRTHYLLGAAYLFGLYAILNKRRDNWQALLIAFAITAPLLALVTVRATPAYLFVALAVICAAKRPMLSIVFMLLALCFHVSSGLAVGPWLLLLIRPKLPQSLRAERPGPLIAAGLVLALVFLLFGQALISSLLSAIESFPVLTKYMAYSQDFGPPTATPHQISISHYVFFVFTMLYTALFLMTADKEARQMNLYIVSSLLIYIVLFLGLSPVAAFRQACFWQLPMTAVLPWNRLQMGPALAPLLAIASIGFFIFQLSAVYQ